VSYTIGVVVFVVALLLSVMLHEAGHFLTAKHYGMKATQFFVGFGPTLWSRQRGETEYGFKAIPAGGYVKIIGMTPLEQTDPADEPRVFYKRPLKERVVVLAAGSTIHIVIAVVLLGSIAIFEKIPTNSLRIDSVVSCLPYDSTVNTPASTNPKGCGANTVAAPAAGVLRGGDVVTAVDGTKVASYDALTRIIRAHAKTAISVTVLRAGKPVTVSLTPVTVLRGDASTGAPGRNPVGAIGIGPGENFSMPTGGQILHNLHTTFGLGQDSLLGGTGHALAQLPSKLETLFNAKTAGNPDGPVSIVGAAQISGSVLDSSGAPLSVRIWTLVGLIGSVNFFFGIINLLPLLPFDGGHIAVSVADRVRGTFRLRRGTAAPGIAQMYTAWAPASYLLFAVVTVASLLILASNIAHPVHL
jgi:membrane-associated protease RseP (regulator of RpoE activity)